MTSVDDAREMLRGLLRGVLIADEVIERRRFVIDRATGALVMPVPRVIVEAHERVLHVPEEDEGGLQLLVEAEEVDAEEEACDRWKAYFGDADQPRWVRLTVDAWRAGGRVWSGEELGLASGLRAIEPKLVKLANARKDAMSVLPGVAAASRGAQPVCVGVDEYGIDVRVWHGVHRVRFDRGPVSAESAGEMLAAMLDEAQRGGSSSAGGDGGTEGTT